MCAKRFFAGLFMCLGLCVAHPAAANDSDDAKAFTVDLGHKALAVLSDNSGSKQDKRERLEALFAENVDIDWVGKFVLGRFWKSATDEQKQQYITNYKTFLIKHYTSNLTEYSNADFEVTRVVAGDNGASIVSMRIKRPGAEDFLVDYSIRRSSNGALMVYDIVVEGVSMITTQRSEFSSVVSQKGLDYLIAQLAQRSKREELGDEGTGGTKMDINRPDSDDSKN